MFVKVSADHFTVLRPVREGDGGAVHADKPFSIVMDERNKSGLLLRVHLQSATGVEKYGVKIIQILGVVLEFFLCQHFGVGTDRCGPQSTFAPQTLERSHGVGNGFVPVAFFLADDQEMLLWRGYRLRIATVAERDTKKEQGNRQYLHL